MCENALEQLAKSRLQGLLLVNEFVCPHSIHSISLSFFFFFDSETCTYDRNGQSYILVLHTVDILTTFGYIQWADLVLGLRNRILHDLRDKRNKVKKERGKG